MNKNIKQIKDLNLKCYCCNHILNLKYIGASVNSYEAVCENEKCKKCLSILFMFHFNQDEFVLCSSFILSLIKAECGFYCDDFYTYPKQSYDGWIKLSNDDYFKLLLKYSEDSNIEYIIEKYKTLILFQ